MSPDSHSDVTLSAQERLALAAFLVALIALIVVGAYAIVDSSDPYSTTVGVDEQRDHPGVLLDTPRTFDQLMYVQLFDHCIENVHLPDANQIDSCRDYAVTGATQ